VMLCYDEGKEERRGQAVRSYNKERATKIVGQVGMQR
jgi:hypothetical protein